MLKLYKKNLNLQTNKFNFFKCFILYKKILSSSILNNIYYFILNFINLSIESIYYYIQDLFFFLKFNFNFLVSKLFFEFSNFFYFKGDFSLINNLEFLFQSKIYFYYIYKRNKQFFFFDFNFLDSYRINYLFNFKTDVLSSILSKNYSISFNSTCLYVTNLNYFRNNNFYLNLLSNTKFNINFISFFYCYILNLNIISLYLKFFTEISNFNTEFYFFIVEYKLKDYINIFRFSIINFYYSYFYFKCNSNHFKLNIKNNYFFNHLINNYILYKNLFSVFYFKLIVKNFNL